MSSLKTSPRANSPDDDTHTNVRFGITARVMIRAFTAIMVVFVLASILHIRDGYVFREKTLISRVNLLSELQAGALSGPLWKHERSALKNILKRLDKSPNFKGARITDPAGKVIIETDAFTPDTKWITARRQITWSDAAGQTRLIGYVDVAFGRDGLKADLYNAIIVTITISFGLFGVMFIAIYVATRWITQPMDVLNVHILDLARGTHNTAIPYQSRDDEIGRLARAIAVLKDNAFELNALRGDLDREVYAQTRNLHAQMVAADNASRAKSKFLSTMSHEMRTPLNAIMGYAQLMEMETRRRGTSHDSDAIKQVMLSSRQLLALLNQVLNLSAIEFGGTITAKIETLPLDVIVKEIVEQAQGQAIKHKVVIDPMTGSCWYALVRVDPVLLRQALGNLLSNAIIYSRLGGHVKVTCEYVNEDSVRVLIADNGPGIALAEQGKLFQPFARIADETSVHQGLGIGLPIAKKLVEAIGGDLDFESTPGRGSTFWVNLPRSAPPSPRNSTAAIMPEDAEHPALDIDENAAPHVGTVLYVEDTPANVALLEQYFILMKGPKLLIATSGEEGVKVALAKKPDLILMDINLPGISGTQAMQELRAHGDVCADIPIIAISADSSSTEIERALTAGFDDYITKPIQLSVLQTALKKNIR